MSMYVQQESYDGNRVMRFQCQLHFIDNRMSPGSECSIVETVILGALSCSFKVVRRLPQDFELADLLCAVSVMPTLEAHQKGAPSLLTITLGTNS